MTAREKHEARKAQSEANDYRTADPALRSLIDLVEAKVNNGPDGDFMTVFNMASDIIEPK